MSFQIPGFLVPDPDSPAAHVSCSVPGSCEDARSEERVLSNTQEQPVPNGFSLTNTLKRNVSGSEFQSKRKYFNLASEIPAELVSLGAPEVLCSAVCVDGDCRPPSALPTTPSAQGPSPGRTLGQQSSIQPHRLWASLRTRHLCSSPATSVPTFYLSFEALVTARPAVALPWWG